MLTVSSGSIEGSPIDERFALQSRDLRRGAYLALKADVPLLPTTFTGTENAIFYNNLKKLRRTKVTMTVGPTFRLQAGPDQRTSMEAGTQRIMLTLADQLPPEYRGVYTNYMEQTHGG
jgi:1-acyl-sn-glycerol-3-phosphate acyltransferase